MGLVVIGVYPHADLFLVAVFARAANVEQAPGFLRIENQVGIALYPVFQNEGKIVSVLPIVPMFFRNSPEPFGLALAEAGIFTKESLQIILGG